MAKKKPPVPVNTSVTTDRAARLYRLIHLLSEAAQTRANLLRRLGLNIRGFYRDLETLRTSGILIMFDGGKYRLESDSELAFGLLPFPDVGLTLGEAKLLAKGRSKAHVKIREWIDRIEK